MDNLYYRGEKCPQIENLEKITPEQVVEYVRFVEHVRDMQRRYFAFRSKREFLKGIVVLEESRRAERELDALNARLLDTTPKLF